MVFAALTSGGKDSVLACQMALDAGIDVGYMVTARPANPHSYMFHSSNLDAVPAMAGVAGMACVEVPSGGEKEVELTDLERGLAALPIDGLVAGAVASWYQRDRIDGIAGRLGLEVFLPLWGTDPGALLRQVAARLHAIIVVTAADGLDESFLGARIDAGLIGRLERVAASRGIHLAGEGGEYETLTLDAPFFSRPITYSDEERRRSPGRNELVLRGFA